MADFFARKCPIAAGATAALVLALLPVTAHAAPKVA